MGGSRTLPIPRWRCYPGLMVPPWKALPDILLRSIGWRMGRGEDYVLEFDEWFARKHDDAKQRYMEEHPEPSAWAGFYARRGLKPTRYGSAMGGKRTLKMG